MEKQRKVRWIRTFNATGNFYLIATPEEQAEGTPVEGGEAPEGAADAVEGEAPPEVT